MSIGEIDERFRKVDERFESLGREFNARFHRLTGILITMWVTIILTIMFR
jgi:hypothetical protein